MRGGEKEERWERYGRLTDAAEKRQNERETQEGTDAAETEREQRGGGKKKCGEREEGASRGEEK